MLHGKTIVSGDNEYLLLEDGTVDIKRFYHDEILELLQIPAQLDGIAVTSISMPGFLGAKVRAVEIPESVTTIGKAAFEGCDNLTIIAQSGSCAETYAKENGIPCINPN